MPYPCPPLLKMMIDFPFSPFLMGYDMFVPERSQKGCHFKNIFQKFRSSEPRFHIMTLQPLTCGFHFLHCSNVHRSGFRLDLHNQQLKLVKNLLPVFPPLGFFWIPKFVDPPPCRRSQFGFLGKLENWIPFLKQRVEISFPTTPCRRTFCDHQATLLLT